MASPLSVGDVIALSKLAIALGRAFTKGRRSAPEEFREVETQLYSLGAALDAITSLVPESVADTDAQDSLSHAIQSCRRTLTHLETVVTKYGVLKKDSQGKPDGSRFRRWNTGLKTGWKSILWTTEGGDLAALRSNLTIHMNSLDLLLGVMVNTQTGQLKTRVDQIHTVLQDVRSWLSENLPTSAPGSRAQTWQTTTPSNEEEPTYSYFQLYEWTDKEVLVCSVASLTLPNHNGGTSEGRLFTCNCPGGPLNTTSPHRTQLEALQWSPLSFSSRIAGSQRVIMLYKISDRNTASMKTMLAKKMTVKGMATMEEMFLHRFPLQQSRSLLLRNVSTLMCYAEASDIGGSPRAHILHLIGDPVETKQRVKSVTIERGLMSLKQSSIDTVQLLHYKTVELEKLLEDPTCVPETAVHYNKTAEVSVFYGAQKVQYEGDDEMARTALELTPSIRPKHVAGDITVLFDRVNTRSFDTEDTGHAMPDVKVTFEFFEPRAAMSFFTKVENMRMELFILHLQLPRPDEKVLLKVSAKDIHTENLHMTSANIQILKNGMNGKYRLLMVDNTGYCVVSQDLAENFLSSPSSPGQPPNFRSPTYVVQMNDEGSRKVREYPKGFAYLAFSEASVERLFKIGLSAVAEANTELLEPPDRI